MKTAKEEISDSLRRSYMLCHQKLKDIQKSIDLIQELESVVQESQKEYINSVPEIIFYRKAVNEMIEKIKNPLNVKGFIIKEQSKKSTNNQRYTPEQHNQKPPEHPQLF